MADEQLTEPAKLLLLASLLSKDRIITQNGKGFLKEVILGRDPRLAQLLASFGSQDEGTAFLDTINVMIEDKALGLYERLFSECSLERGKSVSKAERETRGLTAQKSLIYGEVEFQSFARVLRKIMPAPGGKFYDLGSGTGKAVFVARFLHDFDSCVGIEILEGLHEAGEEVVQRYDEHFRKYLACSSPGDVKLVKGSVMKEDWSDGDLVFANSTCFDDELMDGVSFKAEALKPGAFVVTFTKGLTSNAFEIMERKRYKMSWGPATVYIHRRLNHDGTPFSDETLQDVADDDSYKSYDEDEDDNAEAGASVAMPTATRIIGEDDEEDDVDDEDGAEGGGEDPADGDDDGNDDDDDDDDDDEALEDLD